MKSWNRLRHPTNLKYGVLSKQPIKRQPSANIQMVFLLPSEFRALADQEVYSDFDESEYEEIVAKLIVVQQAIFDKPVKHRHLKALYVKGFIDGKSMSIMLVDGGDSVNLMPYTTFCKLGKGPEDLIETDMMLKDFGGNASKTRGAINVELTIESKTLLTTFFVIDGKVHTVYSLVVIGFMPIIVYHRLCING